jgi:hypothetical protein
MKQQILQKTVDKSESARYNKVKFKGEFILGIK